MGVVQFVVEDGQFLFQSAAVALDCSPFALMQKQCSLSGAAADDWTNKIAIAAG